MDVIALRPGEEVEVTLPGLGTAGYRWSETLQGDTDAVTVQWRRGFGEGNSGPRRVGASAPERLVLTAVAPGRVSVQLQQRRPWEDGPPNAERTVEIEVSASPP